MDPNSVQVLIWEEKIKREWCDWRENEESKVAIVKAWKLEKEWRCEGDGKNMSWFGLSRSERWVKCNSQR